MPKSYRGNLKPKYVSVSREDIFEQYPEDQKEKILERAKLSISKLRAMIKFRPVKEVVRHQLISSASHSPP